MHCWLNYSNWNIESDYLSTETVDNFVDRGLERGLNVLAKPILKLVHFLTLKLLLSYPQNLWITLWESLVKTIK